MRTPDVKWMLKNARSIILRNLTHTFQHASTAGASRTTLAGNNSNDLDCLSCTYLLDHTAIHIELSVAVAADSDSSAEAVQQVSILESRTICGTCNPSWTFSGLTAKCASPPLDERSLASDRITLRVFEVSTDEQAPSSSSPSSSSSSKSPPPRPLIEEVIDLTRLKGPVNISR